ncbi:hypothetical protein BDZ91DRAFT_430141 [Kalaharituber pfeilii]|nr:hypothetical protein BDZ91DRAFT_430141 [Kalaharituber pfeilii]
MGRKDKKRGSGPRDYLGKKSQGSRGQHRGGQSGENRYGAAVPERNRNGSWHKTGIQSSPGRGEKPSRTELPTPTQNRQATDPGHPGRDTREQRTEGVEIQDRQGHLAGMQVVRQGTGELGSYKERLPGMAKKEHKGGGGNKTGGKRHEPDGDLGVGIGGVGVIF